MDTIDTNPEGPKLCTNCAHIGTNSSMDWHSYKCFAPQNFAGINLIDGHKEYATRYCELARASSGKCGAEGNWYEPKPAPAIVPVTASELSKAISTITRRKSGPDTNLLEELGI